MARDLLFEIGVEEVPSAPLYDAIRQLKKLADEALASARLTHGGTATYCAPRRIVLYVQALEERQADLNERARGPAVAAAFDADGVPTKAAQGFARGKGVAVEDLERGQEGGGEYVFAVIDRPGAAALDVLPELLAGLVSDLDWVKSQRWGSGEARFIRPVRWLAALHGDHLVPVEFAGLTAGHVTWGHRFLAENPVDIGSAEEYGNAASRGRFIYDHEERARLVREGIEISASASGASAVVPEKTFAEVVNLVEWPTVAVGRFDDEFLRVPREVLETAMESHQRYFPTQAQDGSLLARFVVVHNGDPERTVEIVTGHERVLRARLADASFFYSEDLAADMEDWVARLADIVFHDKLGTLAAKVVRVEALCGSLAYAAGVDAETSAQAARAAHLAKADLTSHVVVEFPTLQGVMGRYYALAAGEDAPVAEAILEHYRPRFASDAPPSSAAGMLVSAADRLDTLCGLFAIGQAPTGSADPYALRRGSIGLLSMVLDGGLKLQLSSSIAAALEGYADLPDVDTEAAAASVKEYVLGRLEGVLKDRGHAYDTVAAVLVVENDDPADVLARCEALTDARKTAGIDDVSVAFARAKNLGSPILGTDPDPALMEPSESVLREAMDAAEGRVESAMEERDYPSALAELASLRGPIDTFFDDVLVMDEDEGLRDNRLKLLNRFVALFERFADFSQLAG